MKKLYTTFVAVFALAIPALAQTQWTTTGSDISNTNTGSVGIGIASPSAKLHVISTSGFDALKLEAPTLGPVMTLNNTSNANQTRLLTYSDGNTYFQNTGNLVITGIGQTNPYLQVSANGNVGIGTTNPGTELDIRGQFRVITSGVTHGSRIGSDGGGFYISDDDASTYPFRIYGGPGNGQVMTITPSGSLGIGNSNPVDRLVVTGAIRSNVANTQGYGSFGGGFVAYDQDNGGNHLFSLTRQINNLSISSFDGIGFCTQASSPSNSYQMYINAAGNVLIGQTTQANAVYKLDVKGGVRANEIVVNTTGADFVFDGKYKLPGLSQVAKYIKENHHLPDIASADNMKANGVGLGEMNIKLLQKVEELTLYQIEQEKKAAQQEARIAALEAALAKLTKTAENK